MTYTQYAPIPSNATDIDRVVRRLVAHAPRTGGRADWIAYADAKRIIGQHAADADEYDRAIRAYCKGANL